MSVDTSRPPTGPFSRFRAWAPITLASMSGLVAWRLTADAVLAIEIGGAVLAAIPKPNPRDPSV